MYRAAVIGLGNIGLLYDLEPQRPHPSSHVMAYELSPGFDVVCGIDSDRNKGAILHKISPDARYFGSLENAINSGIMNDVDAISICTPPETHLDIILKLAKINLGKIIFCEKPLVRDVTEAELLEKIVARTNIIIVPNISRRWNTGLRKVSDVIKSKQLGVLEKINIRYTRGVYNTGSHLFDLLKMWTGCYISRVFTVNETETSALPEKTFSFCFELENGVKGYAEAIDDRNYYQFDMDLFCSNGKIEMRNSGNDIIYRKRAPHHLFQGFQELVFEHQETDLLNDACIKNAVDNIERVLNRAEMPYCQMRDAIYPLYVAKALEESFISRNYAEVQYE